MCMQIDGSIKQILIFFTEKHREREKEYHQKLGKLRQEETKKIETEEDLFHRLDQLEIEEELADELNRHVILSVLGI